MDSTRSPAIDDQPSRHRWSGAGRRLAATLALVAVVVASLFVADNPARAAAGFTVEGGRLLDANGNEFVMRGVNIPYAWYTSETASFADAKALGANTVRVVLASGQRWNQTSAAEVSAIVDRCKANRLICVLEVHDTTGYGEQSGAATLDQAVDYWIRVQDALAGEEAYAIVNIGNEPHGNVGAEAWTADTTRAIRRLRTAGFDHTIMVDAPNWGQDWSMTMRDTAPSVFAADPDRNTVFSVHMYGVFDTAAEVSDYLGRFVDRELPIVVGEFGDMHSDGDPDEDAIMATAERLDVGYLGWSWSGNGGGVEYLDMVEAFDASRLTPWGERFFHGPNGVVATSRQASVYGSTPPTTRPTTSTTRPTTTTTRPPTTTPPGVPAPTCSVDYEITSRWGSGFVAEVRVTNLGRAVDGWEAAWSFPGNERVREAWNMSYRQEGKVVRATNAAHNASVGRGSSVSMGFRADAGPADGEEPIVFFEGRPCSK